MRCTQSAPSHSQVSERRAAAFPPPNNTFERVVFQTPTVQMYVVLTTRHRFAAGDWDLHGYEAFVARNVDLPQLSAFLERQS